MKRRDFLMRSAVTCVAGGSLTPVLAQTTVSEITPDNKTNKMADGTTRRRFKVIQQHQLIRPFKVEGPAKLWIPLPEDTHFQELVEYRYSGTFKEAFVTDQNDYKAQTLFAIWPDSTAPMALTLEAVIETQNWEPALKGELQGYQPPAQINYPQETQLFLKATEMMPLDGIVKETAEKIVGSETNPLKQARLIYEWVTANMERDNSVIGCGIGDVKTILTTGKLSGKCTDISSVFVALVRSVGIPAREMFGIRLGAPSSALAPYSKTAFGSADANGLAQISGGQHCRTQFYLAGFGWVPCDPADVTKMRLAERKTHSDADVQAVNEYLFGNWDMNWVGFNYGRDFELYPQAEQAPMNQFGYPYAEIDGNPLDYYDPEAFSYEYQSQEENQA